MASSTAALLSSNGRVPANWRAAAPHVKQSSDEQAIEVREAFTQFVGQTFFGQMIGAMRTSLGKPAYFHGGQAEEIFRGQLDQVLAEEMTEKSASQFTDPMFRHQFPQLADRLAEAEKKGGRSGSLDELKGLVRR
jgi:hypothetical protein